ncbi:MAG: T9SS type A sorting domain-containing protein [Bacteroidota bacterium]|jgi:hypothetical protein
MKRFFLLLFLIPLFNYGQAPSKKIKVSKKGELNFYNLKEDFFTDLQCIEKPLPGGIPKKTDDLSAKKSVIVPKINQSNILQDPYLGRNFFGNVFYNSTPNDNDLAVSDNCKIISVSNTLIYFYDCDKDSALGTQSLSAFSNALGLQHEEFDPIVEYDPVNDRFILACLNGFTDSTSSIILGFSQSNDPKGSWNLYNIPGNPKNNGLWTDYPMMSVSPKELFLTVNLLYPDSSWQTGFVESLIWQIRKEDGYNGDTLTMVMHDSIGWAGKPVRNLCPVRGGSFPYGPNQYFLSNRNFAVGCDTVFLVQISDTIGAVGQQLSVLQLNSNKQYSFPPDARQFGFHKMATNDSRNLGAFYENNKIQYVHNTLDTVTGFCAVYHGVINSVGSNPIVNGYILNDTIRDFGYPNISYAGNGSSDNSAIINLNHTAPTVNAGYSVIKSDGNGQYSNVVTVKNGGSYVNVLNNALERWGDYSGSQRKYNEPDKIWTNGYYGYLQSSSRRHGTWIGEISLSPTGVGIIENNNEKNLSIFPNPVPNVVNIEFETEKSIYLNFVLYDLNGKQVKVLMRELVKQGKNRFSFSLDPLPDQVYIIRIFNNENSFKISKKLIKSVN